MTECIAPVEGWSAGGTTMDDGGGSHMDRRQFWTRAAAWALLAAAHGKLVGAAPGSGSSAESPSPTGDAASGASSDPRILGLRLLTSAPLSAMKDFYRGLLRLSVLGETPGEVTFGAGASRLTFVHVDSGESDGEGDGDPFYHFAFNIPENKILSARAWQKERTKLMPARQSLRDPDYPDDVIAFRHWNAHSLFFWDPGGNVVEYIARHDLNNSAPGPFTSEDILYASEIAFIVDDVPGTALDLRRAFELEQYRGGSERFTAVGDESGLLLVMKRGRQLGFPEPKLADCFATVAHVRGAGPERYAFPDFPYEITSGG